MKSNILVVFLIICFRLFSQNEFPFQNPNNETRVRIADLLERLSVEEKIGMLIYDSKPVERLGIPAFNWWNEALHGHARAGRATVFPQAIGLAATFDTQLIEEVASAISNEGRAKFNEALKLNYRDRYLGLTYWTPNINIFRDPRWGRGQETYGEDPYLTAKIGLAFVNGLQGRDTSRLKTAACAKHFAVHSGPEALRHEFNAIVSIYDLWNTYLPAFKTLVDGKVAGIMCAYNRTNNEPCCTSNSLLIDILRKKWSFKGYIVSDCWALKDIYTEHKVESDPLKVAAMAIKSSLSVNCGEVYRNLKQALEKGFIIEKDIDLVLSKNLEVLFRLGWFDSAEQSPWKNLDGKDINSPENKNLSYKAAVKSIVMLKNNGILPLKNNIRSVYVTGPNAAALEALWGNYNGLSGDFVTILEGITNKVSPSTVVNYNPGCELTKDTVFRGMWQIGDSEIIIATIGLNSLMEGESGDAYLSDFGGDRRDMKLPSNQIKYLQELKKSGKPIIAVIMAGSAISIKEIEPFCDAILLAWYPGEQGGNAVADIIFGKQNPSGRLPITIYESINDLPPYDDYSMKGRTYRYFEGKVQYPFGFGLSYSDFEYGKIEADKLKFSANDTIKLSIDIKNISNFDGEEVVQIYFQNNKTKEDYLIKSLLAFKRLELKKMEGKDIEFKIPVNQLSVYSEEKQDYVLRKGAFKFFAGSSSEDIKSEVIIKVE